MSSVTQRSPRKCSQCRQEKCNKNSVNCPVNIARGYTPKQLLRVAGTCDLCRRVGCNTECPLKNLVDHHTGIASRLQRYGTYPPININPNSFDHIENTVLRAKYLEDFIWKINNIYTSANVNLLNAILANNMLAPSIPKKKIVVQVLKEYKMSSEECGICYDKTCKVTFNCNHQTCLGCFKGHYTATKSKNSSILQCPFCRGTIESVQGSNKKTFDTLVGRT
jgi:hypothetical protein